jgi:hypothetical protein
MFPVTIPKISRTLVLSIRGIIKLITIHLIASALFGLQLPLLKTMAAEMIVKIDITFIDMIPVITMMALSYYAAWRATNTIAEKIKW